MKRLSYGPELGGKSGDRLGCNADFLHPLTLISMRHMSYRRIDDLLLSTGTGERSSNTMLEGSITNLETRPRYYGNQLVPGKIVFHQFFWTFEQCREAIQHYKLMIQIDSTWLYRRYQQHLLLVISQDGNGKILPIAFIKTPRGMTDD
ncbi:hypothetical protein J1N35_011823 [Gossypium stocksii]|uniref:Uncharacterized protein n=1 Tax=Gossypium stocksii TaxID=47602 RepID=A0A9D3W569_9ROSI|nr:hypothetical protein J1N35_011823 [Gossypium stocksii]